MKTYELDQLDEETRRKIEKAERVLAWSWVALGLAVFWSALAWIVVAWASGSQQAGMTVGLVVFAAVWLLIILVGGICCSVPESEDQHVGD